MTFTLIRKELRQHWWALLLIGLLSMAGIVWIVIFSIVNDQLGSHLGSLRLHAFLLAVCALILGNRLVVAEYSAQTQIFLESLPLPRGRVVLVKYAIALTTILICAATGLAVAMAAGMRTEVYTPRFLGILCARYFCFAFFVQSFFFAMGFLGRYRFAAYALIVGGVVAVSKLRDLETHELAPIQLVGQTFPFEREVYPVQSLAITGGLGFAFFLLALVLGTAREGSVSSLLGERMSARDKIALTSLCLGLLIAAYVIDQNQEKEPYQLSGGVKAESAAIAEVTVAPAGEVARQLADRLADDLDAMAEYLGIETVPPLFIVERPDLDPDKVERGILAGAEGIILRTPYRHAEWSYARCLEHAAGDVVENVSHRRAMKEDRFWVIDGFSVYWPHRGEAGDPLDRDRHLLLRALYGRQQIGGLKTPADLERWFAHQQVVGHEITSGIGWSMLRVADQLAGAEAARGFVRSVLVGSMDRPSAAAAWRDHRDPMEARFQRHIGIDLAEFLDRWNAELDTWQETLAEPLAALPRLTGELDIEADPGATTTLRYRFEPPAGADSGGFRRPALLYGEPAPFSVVLLDETTKRQPLSAIEPSEGHLRETWGSGVKLCWTIAADVPALRCQIVSGWRVLRIP